MTQRQSELERRLRALIETVIEEARSNPTLERRLEVALDVATEMDAGGRRRGPRRRNAPSLDPFALYEQGEDHFREALANLDLDQLKDVVAGYGMDRARLALRWRTPSRLVELIVDTVKTRSVKGDAFRN